MLIAVILLLLETGCHPISNPAALQQARIDSLTAFIQELKPGLGEFMVQLKYHHDRLAEALEEKDLERAAYEIDEMKETAEKIQRLSISNEKLQGPFHVYYLKYLQTPLENLAASAGKKDLPSLQTHLMALTDNCNSCHHENGMGFMKIK